MEVKIHTVGISGSRKTQSHEKPDIQFHGVLEIDGLLIDHVSSIRVLSTGGEFTSVMVRLTPSTIEHVNHTDDSWEQLCTLLRARQNGSEWLLTMKPEKEEDDARS
jgi:hypothetical protein